MRGKFVGNSKPAQPGAPQGATRQPPTRCPRTPQPLPHTHAVRAEIEYEYEYEKRPPHRPPRLRVIQTARTPNAEGQSSGWKARATESQLTGKIRARARARARKTHPSQRPPIVLVLSPPWRTVLVLVLEKRHSPPPFAPFAPSRLRVRPNSLQDCAEESGQGALYPSPHFLAPFRGDGGYCGFPNQKTRNPPLAPVTTGERGRG